MDMEEAPIVPYVPHIELPQEPPSPPPLITSEHIRYISGFPDGTFEPERHITRAEVASALFNLVDDANRNRAMPNRFSDVSVGAWYGQSVNYLAEIGIISGYHDGTFRPNSPMTRAELTTVMTLFFEMTGGTNSFSDIQGHWAYLNINSAYNKGWITGYGDSTFRPNNPITRAEAVTIINRALNRRPNPITNDYHVTFYVFTDLTRNHWAFYEIMEATIEHDFTYGPDGLEIWHIVSF